MSYAEELRFRQNRFAQHVAFLINFIGASDLTISFGEVYRSEYTQREHVRLGNSNTFDSMHLKRLAIDLNFFEGEYYLFSNKDRLKQDIELVKVFGEYWQDLHQQNTWGGSWSSFPDFGHFEHTFR